MHQQKVHFAKGTKPTSTLTHPLSIQEEVEIRSKTSRKRKSNEAANDESETTTSGTQVASATEVLKKMKKPVLTDKVVSDVEVTEKTSKQSSSAAPVDKVYQRKPSSALVPVVEVPKRTDKSPSEVVTVDKVSKKKKEKKSVAEKVIKSVKASNELTAVNYQGLSS